jgi:hypothetical protein
MWPLRDSRFSQAKITSIGDFSDGKSGSIQRARNNSLWAAAAFTQYQVAEFVALPARHGFHDDGGRQLLPTRWSIERHPTGKRRFC